MVTWNLLGVLLIYLLMTYPASTNGLQPTFDVKHHNVTVISGQTAILPCSITDKGIYKVAWTDRWSIALTLDDRRVISDERISISRPYADAWNLEIRHVRTQDEGVYHCLINTNPVRSKSVNLYVKELTNELEDGKTVSTTTALPAETTQVNIEANPNDKEPVFDSGYAEVNVDSGETAILPCTIINLRNYTVIWTNRSHTVLTVFERRLVDDPRVRISRMFVTDWNLNIRSVKPQDEGDYFCRINTEPVRSKLVKLNIKEPAAPVLNVTARPGAVVSTQRNYPSARRLSFDTSPRDVVVNSGDTAVLPCHVENLGSKEVGWVKEKGAALTLKTRLFTTDRRISIFTPYAGDWNLQIRYVNKSDQGIYVCFVNTFPVQIKRIQLIVIDGGPTLDSEYAEVTVHRGEKAILPCRVYNLQNHQIVWTRDNRTILTHNHRRLIDDLRISISRPFERDWNLHIRFVKTQDEGIYSCRISTQPVKRKLVQLNVQDFETPLNNLTRPVSATTTGKPNNTTNEPQLSFDTTAINVTVQSGGTAFLPCHVDNLGSNMVGWMSPKRTPLTLGKLSYTADPRISLTNSSITDWVLVVDSVHKDDEGTYTCAVNTKPIRFKQVRLIVSGAVSRDRNTPVIQETTTTQTLFNTTPSKVDIEMTFDRITVKSGDTAVLPCSVNNMNGSYKVVWQRDQSVNPLTIGDMVFTANRRLFVTRPSSIAWNLIIRDVKLEDEGIYHCKKVSLTRLINVKQIQLAVKDFETPLNNLTRPVSVTTTGKPNNTTNEPQLSFDTTAINVTVQSGGTAFLPCHVDNLGSHVVGWMSPKRTPLTLGELSSAYPRISLTNSSIADWVLVINSVHKDDEGTYTCAVNTKPIRLKQVRLIVTDAVSSDRNTPGIQDTTTQTLFNTTPSKVEAQISFDTREEVITVLTGDTAVLPCHTLGNNVMVAWLRKSSGVPLTVGRVLYTPDKRVSLDQPNTGDWNLRIRSVTTRDEGEYICQVNTPTRTEKVVRLNVKVLGVVLSGTEIVRKEDDIVLKCTAVFFGGRSGEIDWFLNGNKIKSSVRTFILSRSQSELHVSELRIQSATLKDAGTYECWTSDLDASSIVVHVLNEAMSMKRNTSMKQATTTTTTQTTISTTFEHQTTTETIVSGVVVSGTKYVGQGDDIILKCTTTFPGGRFGIIDWFVDGNKITMSNRRAAISVQSQDELYASELRIQSATLGDAGTYVCRTSDLHVGSITVHVLNEAMSKKRNGRVQQAKTTTPTIINTTFEPQTTTKTIEIPLRMVDYSDDVIAVEGNDVVLWCRAVGYPKLSITWYRITKDRNRTKTEIQTGKGVLEIQNVKRIHSGEYKCVASTGNSSAKARHIRLTVEFPPEVTIIYNNSVGNGDPPHTLICQITGHPLSYYGWTLNKREIIKSSDKYKIAECKTGEFELTYSLTINHTENQVGDFSCEAINQHGVASATVTLRGQHRQIVSGRNSSTQQQSTTSQPLRTSEPVSGRNSSTQQQSTTSQPLRTSEPAKPSKIELYPSHTFVVENSPISLFCELQGRPNAFFSWKRNDKRFLGRAKRYEVIYTPNGSILRIHDVRSKKDNANFTCVATDGFGVQQVTAKLTVYKDRNEAQQAGVPVITVNPSLRAAEEGDTARLSCEATASQFEDTLRLYWLKDNIPVKVDGERISYYKQGNLRINRVNEDDQGAYECVAENAVGTTYSYKAMLYVRVRNIPPRFEKPVPPEIRTKPGRNVTLECTAVGSPMPVVKWYTEDEVRSTPKPKTMDGPIFRDTLFLTDVKKSETYICIASNRLGYVEASTKVIVI